MTSLFQLTDGEMTELKRRLNDAGLDAELGRLINRSPHNGLARIGVSAIKTATEAADKTSGPARQAAEQPIETVTVPDLPAAELLAAAKAQAGLTYLDPGYERYSFVRGERGKTYEVLKWKPGRGVSSDTVREHFRALGFAGNAAAFISWVARNHPVGWFVSIPEDDECFVGGGALHAPIFDRGGSGRELGLGGLAGGWGGGIVFVAFREIPQK